MINKKRLILVIIILAVLLAVVFSSSLVYKFFTASNSIALDFQKGVSYRIENFKKNMLFINNEEMKIVSSGGKILFTAQTGISEPSVSVRGDYILISDISGNIAYLYKKEKLIKKFSFDNSIYSAKVNKKGYCVFATGEKGYKGMITVLSHSGKEIFKWHSGSGYIADVDISQKNNVIVSQVLTDKDFINSKVLFFNTKKNKETECRSFENTLVAHLRFNDDNTFVSLSDTCLTGYSSKGAKKYQVDFMGRSLLYYNTFNMNNIVLSFRGSVNDCIIESYSHSGKLKGTYKPNENIDSIDVNGELIVTSSGRKITAVTPKGKVKSKKTISHDISNIKIFYGRKKAVLLGGNDAVIYNIYWLGNLYDFWYFRF